MEKKQYTNIEIEKLKNRSFISGITLLSIMGLALLIYNDLYNEHLGYVIYIILILTGIITEIIGYKINTRKTRRTNKNE